MLLGSWLDVSSISDFGANPGMYRSTADFLSLKSSGGSCWEASWRVVVDGSHATIVVGSIDCPVMREAPSC